MAEAQLQFYQCSDSLSKSNFIYDIKIADGGYMYIANDNGLLESDGSKSHYIYQSNEFFPQAIFDANNLGIVLNNGDSIYVRPGDNKVEPSSTNQNFNNYSYTLSDSITVFNGTNDYSIQPSDFQKFTDASLDNNGSLWIAESRNLFLHLLGSENLIPLKIGDNFQEVGINCIEIIGHHLWIGTNGYGLFYLNLNESYIRLDGSNDLRLAGASNNILYANTQNSILKIELQSKDFSHTKKVVYSGSGILASKLIDNNLYAVHKEFVSIIDSVGQIKKIIFHDFEANGIIAKFKGKIYLGSFGSGVLIVDGTKQTVVNTTNGLLHNEVIGFVSSKERILAYSKKGGVTDIENTDNYIDYRNNGIQGNIKSISNIAEEWWICTEGYGIKVFDKNLHLVASIDQSNALNTGFVLSVFEHQNGVYGVMPSDLFFIKNNEINNIKPSVYFDDLLLNGSYAAPSSKDLVFETNKGILLKKDIFKNDQSIANIKINTVLINGYPIDQKTPLGSSNTVEINLDAIIPSPLKRELSLTYYLNGKTEFSNRLQSKQIVIKDLSYGEYTLTIKDNDDEILCSYSFEIGQALYLQPLFWISILLILVILVYAIVHWRLRIIRLQNIQLEKKIAARTREIQKKSKLLEQISFTLSHDLKTPAHNIIELAKILGIRVEGSEKFSKLFDEAGRQILLKTLDTLEVLRSDSGNESAPQASNLSDILENAIQPLNFQIEKTQAEINISVAKDVQINVKKAQWQSVFFNLVSNAIKYCVPGTPPRISISHEENENEHIIKVEDQGIGVDTEKVNVFDRFSTGDTSGDSTGVGLTLVKQIIESHSGSISIQSAPNNGATFTIRLKK
jgi:signal transduction histidine kinase